MRLPTNKLSKEEQKIAALEAHEVSERMHHLVVKIISWKTGPLEGASIKKDDKVTPDEWKKYSQHLLNISKSESEKRIQQKLREVHEAIAEHGGFE